MITIPMAYEGHNYAVRIHQAMNQNRLMEQDRVTVESQFRNLADQIPCVLYQCCLRPDGSSYFPYAGEGMQAMYGVSPQQALLDGGSVFAAVHTDDYHGCMDSLQQSANDLSDWTQEYRVVAADGTTRWIWANAKAQRQAGGGTVWHGFMCDVTGRKRAELRALRHQTRLQEMVAQAMTQVHALSMELLTSEARERRQISEDLHDNLGQSLAMVRFKLRSLTALDNGSDEGETGQQLREIGIAIERAIQSVRSLTAQLWPPVLYKFGLGAALEWLVGEMEINNGMTVSLQLGTLLTLDEVTSIFIFRTARELLNNVWKHAQVSRAEMSVSTDSSCQMLVLRVADSGLGFDIEQIHNPQSSSGFGLFSVNERVKLFGGTLHIDSKTGGGTVVTIRFPLPARTS